MPYGVINFDNIGLVNDLLPDSTKPLPDPKFFFRNMHPCNASEDNFYPKPIKKTSFNTYCDTFQYAINAQQAVPINRNNIPLLWSLAAIYII